MSLSELLAEARRKQTPKELERFLEEACGTDLLLLQELRRQLANSASAAAELRTSENVPPCDADGADAAPASGASEFSVSPGEFDLAIDEVVAEKYKLRDKLGEGGMGQVFAADQIKPVQRRVALKVIKAGMDSSQVLGRFAQERQALALMAHPNIARIYDGGVTRGGRPFFVMELVRGLSLTKYCDHAKLGVRERIALLIPVCEAVQHAHQKGIIHRDLKPSNILVGLDDGKPIAKIIDFGVAKALNQGLTDETIYTARNTLVGTLEYMAPEQAALTNLDIDTRADIYSLGVVLYELLCGALPFSRKDRLKGSLDEIIRIIREEEPKKPSTRITVAKEPVAIAERRRLDPPHLQQLLQGDLDWVVMKCLEKERDRRYASAAGLAADLGRYLREEPVLAAPPSTRYRMKKFFKRNRGKVTLAAAALMVLIVASIIAMLGWMRAVNAEKLAVDEAGRAVRAERAAKDEAERAVRAEKSAKEEASIHQALTTFIQKDLFSAADPEERARLNLPLDSAVPLRTLIDRASRHIDDGPLAKQPLVEAALRYTLARAYLVLGLLEPALVNAQRSESLRATHLGPDDPLRADALVMIGKIHGEAGRSELADRALREALVLRRKTRGDDHPEVLEIRFVQASVLRAQSRYDEAEAALRELVRDWAKIPGPVSEGMLEAQRSLAELLMRKRLIGEAEPLLNRTLDACRHNLGKQHTCTLGTLNALASLYQQTGRSDRAEPLFRELIGACKGVYADDHPLVGVFKNNLAICYSSQGRYGTSLPILQEIEPIFARIGLKHRLTLVMNSNLARALAKTGATTEAIPRYEGLKPRFMEIFGKERIETWKLLTDMAAAYADAGNLERSAAQLEELLGFIRATKPYDDRSVGSTALSLAATLAQLNRSPRAIAVLTEVAAEMPQDSPSRQQVQEQLNALKKKP